MNEVDFNSLNVEFIYSDQIEIALIPQLGGSISFAKFNDIDFMRPWTGERSPRRTAGYPLVPFSNRIANGWFEFENKTYQLIKNFGDHPHTIHGIGWQKPWQIEEKKPHSIKIYYLHSTGGRGSQEWPYAFKVQQEFSIRDNLFEISMILTNTGTEKMPAGLGWHPFFPRHQGVEIMLSAQNVYLNDETMLPQKLVPIKDEWNFSHQKELGFLDLDNCFSDWDGKARMVWKKDHLSLDMLASKKLRNLILMTPPEPSSFFALEPVSHANNAIRFHAEAQAPMHILEPGESLNVWVRYSLKII